MGSEEVKYCGCNLPIHENCTLDSPFIEMSRSDIVVFHEKE